MKKIILTLFILILSINNIYAYTSNELITIYYNGTTTRQDVYSIPEGKDFIIQYMYSDTLTSANFGIRDNGNDVTYWAFENEIYNINFVIKDLLQLIDSATINHFTITGILVDEGEDISSIINWEDSGINKKIFDKATLFEIYEYEALIMLFILFYTFFMRVIGAKQKKKVISF